jgi:DNA-binding winged helix-turn-helix (wHTH) protein
VQFVFADHVLDTERRELRCGPELIALDPQVLDLLVYLVQNRDRVVGKDDLIASVWGGRIVSDANPTSRIYAARKALGDDGRHQTLIRTIARKGHRFVGTVRLQSEGGKLAAPATALPSDEPKEESQPTLPLPDRPAIAVLASST